jgi:hypothetical protein
MPMPFQVNEISERQMIKSESIIRTSRPISGLNRLGLLVA